MSVPYTVFCIVILILVQLTTDVDRTSRKVRPTSIVS
jgi:hypothetical protein